MYYIYVDEAGRGPLAGPVYVGIIVEQIKNIKSEMKNKKGKIKNYSGKHASDHLSVFKKYKGYGDSKIFSEQQREVLYTNILGDKDILFASGSSKSTEVDKWGIVRSLRSAIARAMRKVFIETKQGEVKNKRFSQKIFLQWIQKHASDITLVIDGKTDFGIRKFRGVDVETIVDGDAIVSMISAASIIAKVERDREMIRHHEKYPQYGFDKHKGYGTKAHYAAIEKYGVSPIHRKSFLKRVLEDEKSI